MGELVSGITQQQALLSELLDARDSDFRLAEAAEALPQFVSDAVAHEARVNRERTVAAIESTLDTKLAEASLDAGTRGAHTEETVAELRAFLQNDPATGSIVAAISTQAATQAMRAEMAEQLPKVVNEALASSEARIDELAERMDKLVTRAMRAGARTAKATNDALGRAGSTTATGRPKKAANPAATSRPPVAEAAAAKVAKASKAAKATKPSARATKPSARATRTAANNEKNVKAPKATKVAKAPRPVKARSESPPSRSPAKRPTKVAAPKRAPAKSAPATTRRRPAGRTERAARTPTGSAAPESA
jgi:hypothetical protein